MNEHADDSCESIPLLMRYAVPRSPGGEISGKYCSHRRVWVEDKEGLELPIIESSSGLAELTTKTKVNHESDDMSNNALLELTTKTHAQMESDDIKNFSPFFLEVTTKTEAQAERDDFVSAGGLDV